MTFTQCYKLLEIDCHSSFNELKKAYRSLVQKWHPDRFNDETEKKAATDKFTELTTAYKLLSDHYNHHGVFPLPEHLQNSTSTITAKPKADTVKTEKTTQNHSKKRTTEPNRQDHPVPGQGWKYKNIFILLSFSIFILGSYQLIHSLTVADSQNSIEHRSATHVQEVKTRTTVKTPHGDRKKDSKFFTYGSSLGDVIVAQGAPDKMEDNIWYYGKSEVHFKDGKVVYWRRDKETHLNVNIGE